MVARFASKESTPVDRDRAREFAEQSDQLARFIADLCLTNESLWDENDRLQAGIDRNLELVAELRGQLGLATARAKAAGTFGMLGGVSLDRDLVERLRTAAESAHHKRFIAAAIDIEDLDALLAVLDQFNQSDG
jgi:hypothetical protein